MSQVAIKAQYFKVFAQTTQLTEGQCPTSPWSLVGLLFDHGDKMTGEFYSVPTSGCVVAVRPGSREEAMMQQATPIALSKSAI